MDFDPIAHDELMDKVRPEGAVIHEHEAKEREKRKEDAAERAERRQPRRERPRGGERPNPICPTCKR